MTIGPHRADVKIPNGPVIEFQHSSISVEEIAERESFYGDMIWVFDATDFSKRLWFGALGAHFKFEWERHRPSHLKIAKPLYWDFGGHHVPEAQPHKLFFVQRIKRVYYGPKNSAVRGAGSLIDPGRFVTAVRSRSEPAPPPACSCVHGGDCGQAGHRGFIIGTPAELLTNVSENFICRLVPGARRA